MTFIPPDDHMLGASLLIRGMEMMVEDVLYLYLCAVFGFEPPDRWYIPRLMGSGSTELADMSKTAGNWKIRDLRGRGYGPELVVNALATSCLIDVRGPWSLDNLRTRPVLSQYAMENL